MKHLVRSLLTAAAALTLASAAFAAPEMLRIDRSHSTVGFQVRHFFSKTPGRFKEYEGTVQFDAKNPAASSVEVTIQAASINTDNERRDADLRSNNFFLVDSFPTLTFKSTKVVLEAGKTALNAGDKFKIVGDLMMKGVTKQVTLDATFLGAGTLGMGGNSMGTVTGFEATTTVNRKDFNIIWNRTLDQGGTMLGDDVTINLAIEAKTPRQAPPAPAAPATPDKK